MGPNDLGMFIFLSYLFFILLTTLFRYYDITIRVYATAHDGKQRTTTATPGNDRGWATFRHGAERRREHQETTQMGCRP
jgi:hypothetical protein